MEKWRQSLLQELLTVCTDLTKGYAIDRVGLAQKLRQLAFEIDVDKKR
jgi:hypothetical protein